MQVDTYHDFQNKITIRDSNGFFLSPALFFFQKRID